MKGWKKMIMCCLSAILAATAFAACGGNGGESSSNGGSENSSSSEPTVERPTEEETRAKAMVATIFEQYGVEGGEGDDAYINLKENYGSDVSGFLWTNFSGVGMQYYMCKLYPDDAEQKDTYRKMLNNFKYFRQSNPESNAAENSVKYHYARGNTPYSGYGDCFFDDNIWVARNYLRAYEIFGEEWYLEEAIRVNNWVLSGWNNELGGLVWSEAGLSDNATEQHLERGLSANACGIMVNAMLSDYAETEEEKEFYMDWAEKFYNFCKKMQNKPDTYDYWNGIHTIINGDGTRSDGDINRVHYAYNSGSMILADLIMYDRTDDADKKAEYMDDALGTAAAAKKTFNLVDPGAMKFYYQGDPWFAAILHEAYYELRNYEPELADEYLESFNTNVKTAYQNRDPETNLCPYQATWTVTWDKNEIWGIHQIGFAEQAVIAALYSIEG